MDQIKKRLFFGIEVKAPWPIHLPSGNLLKPEDRHATLAFLGEVPYKPLLEKIHQHLPLPSFKVGLAGIFSDCLLLPPRHPHVAAWNVQWKDNSEPLIKYREILIDWLKDQKFQLKEHEGEWLCHVTLCRQPQDHKDWKKSFKPLPMIFDKLHLYESLGHSQYQPLWSHSFIPPFQEIEHTADIAFSINGENITQIHRHAQTALAFRYPSLLPYLNPHPLEQLDDIIMDLNEMIAKADSDIGCPFKAISYHGQIDTKETFLQWEMIVDV